MYGAKLSISLAEDLKTRDEAESLIADIRSNNVVPSERLLRLKLGVKWEIGEIGEGGGWKIGDILPSSDLEIVSFIVLEQFLFAAEPKLIFF